MGFEEVVIWTTPAGSASTGPHSSVAAAWRASGSHGRRRRLRARRRSRRQQRRPNPQPVGGAALPVRVAELRRRIVGPAGLDDELGAAPRGPERGRRTVRDRLLLLLHGALCRTLWSGRKRARARCTSSSAPARRPSPRHRPAAPRRGARPPVIVPRRIVPIDPRPPNAVARRPRMLTAKAAALPPDGQPEIGPSETKSDGDFERRVPRATSNPRRRRPRTGRATAFRGGPSCGSPYVQITN